MVHESDDSKSIIENHSENKSPIRDSSELAEINFIIEELGVKLKESVLKSSTRMLMIISLSINKRLTFTELLQLTSIGKGSLSNHLEKLEESGLIRSKTVFSLSGPRLVIEITESGEEIYAEYQSLLRKLMFLEDGRS